MITIEKSALRLSSLTQTGKGHGGKLDPNTPSLGTFAYCLFPLQLQALYPFYLT